MFSDKCVEANYGMGNELIRFHWQRGAIGRFVLKGAKNLTMPHGDRLCCPAYPKHGRIVASVIGRLCSGAASGYERRRDRPDRARIRALERGACMVLGGDVLIKIFISVSDLDARVRDRWP